MAGNLLEATPSAYSYPLLIKHLLYTPLTHAPEQEIVYRGQHRYTYRRFRERIGQLAGALARLGVRPGTTVAVMDWDSHRYLESYFAIPMMGAVLQMVNVRLSPEQILYTLNHASAEVVLVHHDFIPLLEGIKERLTAAKKFVLISDGIESQASSIEFEDEYEALLSAVPSDFDFPDFDENTHATTFYTTGTTGLPKGVTFSHRQLVLHTIATMAHLGANLSGQRFHRGDVYMPIAPMFHVHGWGMPYVATLMGKQVYPGRYLPDSLLEFIRKEGVTFSHCVATVLHMLLTAPTAKDVDLSNWKVLIGGGPLPRGLAKAALDRGIDVFAAYGMSETCPFLTVAQIKPSFVPTDQEEEIRLRGKAGLPWPLVDLRVVDEHMRDGSCSRNRPGRGRVARE
jgi:fatty-acyl-CoA synthase